jgi:hypothetical protein
VICRLTKTYTDQGWLKSLRIGPRMVRFRLKDVIAFEERSTRSGLSASAPSNLPKTNLQQTPP